jgi:5'-methylthioadenosine phosphorylase
MIGIIGGSGLYESGILSDVKERSMKTPFGSPSGKIAVGFLKGEKVAFLPRHGRGHLFSPSRLNARANIYALKKLGVTHIISASAVGSLKEEIKPLDIVVPDQIFDRTRLRESTFFEDFTVHIKFSLPFCPSLSSILINAISEKGYPHHPKGTYVCIEGPQFSTKAESNEYRKAGFDVIGMTALPEAKLAREAEICYAVLATVTDYDVWKEEEVDVSIILENLKKNVSRVREILQICIPKIEEEEEKCECRRALDGAIVTSKELIPKKSKKKLSLLLARYL